MTFSIRTIIRALAPPEHRLSCSSRLWREGLEELRRRGDDRHESGAFLLGRSSGEQRRIERFVYYDDLDPHSLDTGIVVFDGAGYGPLWKICRESRLKVVADVHTHEFAPSQSLADKANPMIATRGHIALIVPRFAERVFLPGELGIYQYEGGHRWHVHSGDGARFFFYVGFWG
jgi:hypothetical protein